MEPRGFLPSAAADVAPLDPSPSSRADGKEGEEGEELDLSPLGESAAMKTAVEEFHGAGAVLGELGVLENKSQVLSIECETPVRVSRSLPYLSFLSQSLLSTHLYVCNLLT